jgi:hypothetical protein
MVPAAQCFIRVLEASGYVARPDAKFAKRFTILTLLGQSEKE